MKFSCFGQKFTAEAGIVRLMEDLGDALNTDQTVYMLGGGNPAKIPAVQTRFRQSMAHIMANDDQLERLIGDYAPPHGHTHFATALANLLNQQFGWSIGPQNIALTNGSQTAFFYLLNMFAGVYPDGSCKKILLPLTPEYIGYADVGVVDEIFEAKKPEFEFLDNHIFKYHVDFNNVTVSENIGAICISRPTNPTGNVITDEELNKLSQLALEHDVPFIIDNAYGTPFPNIIFTKVEPIWNDHIVLCMSLSKLGIPGTRTGIIVANEQIVKAISDMNAIVSLAPGIFGTALTLDLVQSGEIIHLGKKVIQPYYRQKADDAVAWLHTALAGIDYYIHKPEGAFFLWLWFKGIPIDSQTLYERLKQRGVIVVPGHHFFPGLTESWPHKFECLRMSYAQDASIVQQGIQIIGDEVKKAYSA